MSDIYAFTLTTLQGQPLPLSQYQGKVVLVVNTASKCGFTPQYQGLQSLHEQYQHRGLEVIAAPCNQFGHQEPGDANAIADGCLINYGVSFPVTEKLEVNGKHTHPLFAYLKDAAPGLMGNRIKWNFTKFLIGKDGRVRRRYAPTTRPEALVADIEAALAE